jgi:hypothetical protein
MTIARLRTRLEEAKKAAYAAAHAAHHAKKEASLLGALIKGGHNLPDKAYVEYQWACDLRDELKEASTAAAKAAKDAQWYVDLVAAREMTMFDGRDTI